MKESIRVLVPIFIGFVGTHTLLIAYGVLQHVDRVFAVVPIAVSETRRLADDLGWLTVIAPRTR